MMMSSATFWFDVQHVPSILLCVRLITRWMRTPRNLPPGPWGWPIIGYLPNLAVSLYRSGLHPHQHITEISRRYGPVFCFNIAGQLFVVLNTYNSIEEGFQNPHMNDRPKSSFLDDLGILGGISLASGEAWRQQRRFTSTTLRSIGVGKTSYEDNICEESNELMTEIDKIKDTSFDPCKLLEGATANVVSSLVFGQRFDYDDPDFLRLQNDLDQLLPAMEAGAIQMFFPSLEYLQPKKFRLLQKSVQNMAEFIAVKVEEHERTTDPAAPPRDYIDVYLNEIQAGKMQNVANGDRDNHVNSKNHIFTLITMFIAGTDTTSASLRWSILYMMGYPEIQERVQQELDSVVGRNRRPTLADKDSLPYTLATLLEIQRIATTLPLGVAHSSDAETKVRGYTIPRGSIVISNLWAVHNDPEVWIDPHEFNPERFLDDDGCVIHKDELITFGKGPRVCLGENLARMEVFIFFTHLLHRYTFKKPDDSPPLSFKGDGGFIDTTGPYLTRVFERD